MKTQLNKLQPLVLALLRIVTAFLFLQHGTGKLFSIPDISMSPPLFTIFGLAAVMEVVGGLLLIVGLFTRATAFILSGQMAVAYFMFHASAATVLTPLLNGGEAAILFCFIFLYLVFSGAGCLSLDRLLKKN